MPDFWMVTSFSKIMSRQGIRTRMATSRIVPTIVVEVLSVAVVAAAVFSVVFVWLIVVVSSFAAGGTAWCHCRQ